MDAGLTVSKNYIPSMCLSLQATYLGGGVLSAFTSFPLTQFFFLVTPCKKMNHTGGGGVLGAFTGVPLTRVFFRHSLQKMNHGEGNTVSLFIFSGCVNGVEALVGI